MSQYVLHWNDGVLDWYFEYWKNTGPKIGNNIKYAMKFDFRFLAVEEAQRHWAMLSYSPIEVGNGQ